MNARYEGKPLLRLLELYVLCAIGELSVSDAERLNGMAPKLTQLYGGSGTWQDAIRAAMSLPATMPDLIKGSWDQNSGRARDAGQQLSAQQFAEMFVDSNFR